MGGHPAHGKQSRITSQETSKQKQHTSQNKPGGKTARQGRYEVNKLKTMGIAIAMALALTAFAGASAASAAQFKAGAEPQTWSGSRSGPNHSIYVGEGIGCSGVAFYGETKTKTTGELTVTPELSGCSIQGVGAAWQMNGCKYRFHAGPGASMYGTMDIVNCEKPMKLGMPKCNTEIGNQTGLGTIEYKNVGAGESVTVIAKLKGIKYTRSGTCWGFPGTFSDGEYNGQWTVKGLTSTVEVAPTPVTKFVVEEAPATIAGAYSGTINQFKAIGLGGSVNCNNYSLKGTLASTSAEAITLTPTFKECKVAEAAVPDGYVSAGSCSYTFHMNGTFDIVGASCASKPITITGAGCIVTIGPQSGLSYNLAYTGAGSGKSRSVSISGGVQKFTYTATGGGCVEPGTFIGGTINSPSNLTATNSGGAAQGIWLD
jgi:hypothetical protein